MRALTSALTVSLLLAAPAARADDLPPLPAPEPAPVTPYPQPYGPATAPSPAPAATPAPAPPPYERTTAGESVPPTKIGEGKKRSWFACLPQDSDSEIPRLATGCSGVFGVRVPVTSADLPRTGVWVGFGLHAEGEEYLRRGLFSVRGTHRLALAGGGAGFEGTLGGGLAVGARLPFGERHGPVVRLGVTGHVMGNDVFYSSLIEAPQGQVGYQYMRGITVIELGATGGYAIDGRYGQRLYANVLLPVSPLRPLGEGLAFGGYLAVQVPHFRLGVSGEGVPTREGLSGGSYWAQGTLCGMGFLGAICADFRVMANGGLGPFGTPTEATYYGGITFGVSRER
jgi:hypothetical protein